MLSYKTHLPKRANKLTAFVVGINQHTQNRVQIEVLSSAVDREIGASLKDYAEGRYEILETEADIKKFVDCL